MPILYCSFCSPDTFRDLFFGKPLLIHILVQKTQFERCIGYEFVIFRR